MMCYSDIYYVTNFKGVILMAQTITQLVEDTKASYYDYVVKVEGGCTTITTAFKSGDFANGLQGIVDLSEGLSWLIEVENLLKEQSFQIDSPISSVVPLFEKLNTAIATTNYDVVIALLEDELKPLFKHAAEWKFEKVIS